MSDRGELIPELADLLFAIAQKILDGEATEKDARVLSRMADSILGKDPNGILKLHHNGSGAPRHGAAGVDRRYAIAKEIKEYHDTHGLTFPETYQRLDGKFGLGCHSLEKIWKEMRPLFRLDDQSREMMLFFKRLEAKGLANIEKVPREG